MRSPGHRTGESSRRAVALTAAALALGLLVIATASPAAFPDAEAASPLLVTEVESGAPTPTPLRLTNLTRVSEPGCCVLLGWSFDSQSILVLAQPAQDKPAQVQGIPLAGGKAKVVWKRPAAFSPDGSLAVEAEGNAVRVTRRSSGSSWLIANEGRELKFAPDGARVAWDVASSSIKHPDLRQHALWVGETTGARPRKLATTIGGGLVGWATGGQALIATGRMQSDGPEGLWSIGLGGEEPRLIHQAYRPRDVLLSPGGEWIAFHVAFTGDAGQNGLWVVRTDGTGLSKITPFGAYRWRTDGRLLLIPLHLDEAPTLFEVDTVAGRAVRLTDPSVTSLPIAGNEWIVSPDARHVAFVSFADRAIWVLRLPD